MNMNNEAKQQCQIKPLTLKKKVFAPEVQYYCKDIAVSKDL